MEIVLEVELGSRARESVADLPEPAVLEIDVVVQDVGDGLRWWARRAEVGDGLSLTGNDAVQGASIRQAIEQHLAGLGLRRTELLRLRERLRSPSMSGPERADVAVKIAQADTQVSGLRSSIDTLEQQLTGKLRPLDRLRSKLIPHGLLRLSEAYRRISREPVGDAEEFDVDVASLSAPEQIQRRLYLLATSSDTRERAVPRLLSGLLGKVMGTPIELSATRNHEFREYESQLTRGSVEGIPLTSLGTGEQQLLILLLDMFIASTPIVQMEEPEAHLHKELMLPLAEALRGAVEEHTVDQIFIATHHHAFAIAPEYYDVAYHDAHGTRAVRTNRAKALRHFWEPSAGDSLPRGDATTRSFDRITSSPGHMNGQPCIRDMRLTVHRVLDALATYPDREDLRREYPELEDEDIRQALAYAAAVLEHEVIELPSA
jgi:uncharacterized protein (DUF433 family)